jgi:type I site-specific restriction endonuclease
MNKKDLSERDICTKFITPAIRDVAGWNNLQFFEEFTLGKIYVRGKLVESTRHPGKERRSKCGGVVWFMLSESFG